MLMGYYSTLDDNTPMASDNIVKEFDWRTRHGAMNSDSYYYNTDGFGWIPKRRYGQGANDCWAFSTLYSIESMVNLYFNRQINDELSVQNIISCIDGVTYGHGYIVNKALLFAKTDGIINDSCFPYVSWCIPPCDSKCPEPTEKVYISGSVNQIHGEDNIKENLIMNGVLIASVHNWLHAMSMVGFGVVKAGDPILYGNSNQGTDYDIYVDEDSPDIGKPYYIFKQSYAHFGYDKTPFCNVIIDANSCNVFGQNYKITCRSIITPITSLLYNDNDIVCADNDGDGYYNWGIGPKPANCPPCPDEIDSDDTSPYKGPYNEKHESVILCDNYVYSNIPEYITQNTFWGSEKIIDHDILVEDGVTLEIKSTIYMGDSTRIIVKPGGKLILGYNALITGFCDKMWQGIEVWGDASQHQHAVNGRYLQGYLEMKNHSKIENAICAVRLYDPDRPNASTGGIIHAENSYFINNAKAVHAKDYIYHHPNGNELPYNATFRNCKFEINESYSGVHTFYKHVDLANVTGVRFHGCDFSIEVDDGGGNSGGGGGAVRIDNVSYWSEGIAAYNAGFTVDGIYSNYLQNGLPHLEKPSTFSGFHAGAYSVRDGAGGPKTFTVKDCEFRNNDFGVFAIEPNFATVLNSTFTVGRDGSRTCNAGIFLSSTRGFLVEENTFTKGENAVEGNNYGVIIKNSEDVNELYRNIFENLYCGNIAVGKNRVNVNEYASGLTYGCNENDGNEIDFYVDSRTTDGIQREQGSMAVPAGNTFSDDADYHFYNEGVCIDYYYNPATAGATPDESRLCRVYPHSTSSLNGCPSHYGGGNIIITPVLPPVRRQAAEQQFNESRNIYNGLKEVYENRIDGGSTTGTVSEVRAARPEDMWVLRSRLLNISPYLSEDVIYAAADRDDVLPASVLFEILISNPDELKNDTLLNYMANKNTPLPDYMIDILREVAGGTSARTVLLSNMASYSHEAEIAAGDIIRSIMNDSIIDRNDLVTWLGNIQDLEADRDIISIYMAEGNFDDAFALANILPSLYNLEGEKLEDHSDYMQLLNLYRTLAQDGRTTMQLTDAENHIVEDIAYGGKGTSQAMAQSLLKAVYGNFDESCPETSVAPSGRGGGMTTHTEEDISRAMGLSVKANPNPSNTWIVVDCTLPEGFNDAVITLTNSLGLTVYTQTVHGLQGQYVIDTRELPVGVYVLTIRCEDHSLTEKVVVAR